MFLLGTVTLACTGERAPDRSTPALAPAPSPSPGLAADPIPVTGGERLGWDQPLTEPDLRRYRFAAYVDSTRVELPGASCRPQSETVAVCETPLPKMRPGRRTLRLVARIVDKGESPRSAPIELMVTSPDGSVRPSSATATHVAR